MGRQSMGLLSRSDARKLPRAMRLCLPLLCILMAAPLSAAAQQAEDAAVGEQAPPSPTEHGSHREQAHAHQVSAGDEDTHARMQAAMTIPLGLSLTRQSSGTSWQPPSTPMFGHMALVGDWALMLHYNAFAGLDVQGTPRGDTAWPVIGWVMGMARRPLWGGQLTARAMLSPEPFTLGQRGYPLLLQTGETAYGQALVDRQHPHDLIMELALLYQHALAEDLALEVYLAPAGEPALGPVAFPHRLSALTDPLAPLSHHWQDSTHITYGVLTAGVFTSWGKLEASVFNGREPDENRYGLDLRLPDSVSVRGTAIPGENWALQASVASLRSPEVREPEESLRRATASVSYTRRLGGDDLWAATAVFGENFSRELGSSPSFLLEGSVWLSGNVVFGRAQYVHKTAHDFALTTLPAGFALPVGSLVLGYVRTFGPFAGLVPGVGVRGAVNVVGEELAGVYGTRFPLGGMVYLYLRPAEMMRDMQHGH